MSVRVYVPATMQRLAGYVAAGSIAPDEDRFVAPDDVEESEYLALMTAADESAGLVGARGRRVVVVADVPEPDAAIPWRLVAAVHADTEDVDTSAPATLGDLAWFGVQEVPGLLA